MPLSKSMSRGEIIRELLRHWKKTGRIGNQRPESLEKALQVARAIAYRYHPG